MLRSSGEEGNDRTDAARPTRAGTSRLWNSPACGRTSSRCPADPDAYPDCGPDDGGNGTDDDGEADNQAPLRQACPEALLHGLVPGTGKRGVFPAVIASWPARTTWPPHYAGTGPVGGLGAHHAGVRAALSESHPRRAWCRSSPTACSGGCPTTACATMRCAPGIAGIHPARGPARGGQCGRRRFPALPVELLGAAPRAGRPRVDRGAGPFTREWPGLATPERTPLTSAERARPPKAHDRDQSQDRNTLAQKEVAM